MMHRFQLFILLAIVATLSGCGSAPISPSGQADDVRQRSGIEALLYEAEINESPQRENLLLKAVDRLVTDARFAKAQNVLNQIERSRLSTIQDAQYRVLAASLAANRFDMVQVLALLATDNPQQFEQVPLHIKRRIATLKAQAYEQTGQPLKAAMVRIDAAPLFSAEDYWANHERIWRALSKAPMNQLEQASPVLSDPGSDLQGWLQLSKGLVQNQYSLDQQLVALNDWLQRWPAHPVAQQLPRELELLSTLAKERPQHITLMLPLSGSLEAAGRAVLDGFLASYFEDHKVSGVTTQIEVVDSASQPDFLSLYQTVTETDLIIGPLQKHAVKQLQTLDTLSIPTLALNYGAQDSLSPLQMYQFGLAAEDEARQVARHSWSMGYRSAVVIVPEGDWGSRVADEFKATFRGQGGHIAATTAYNPGANYSQLIAELLETQASSERARALRHLLGRSLEYTARRRQDIDMVFLVGNPVEARQINPTLAFHYAADLPVFSVSSIYSGVQDRTRNGDLNGIRFVDVPWMLEQDELRDHIAAQWPERHRNYGRLFALGVDAYRLAPRLKQLYAIRNSQISGATGILTLDEQGRILRTLNWAQFVNGEVVSQPVVVSRR